MKIIQLSQNKQALIDDDDFEKVSQFKWHYRNGYASRSINQKKGEHRITVYLHRFIMDCPKELEIDHINGDKLDNRKENLRICTHAENVKNYKIPKTNTSGYKGVSWRTRDKAWVAQICVNYKIMFLGYFETAEAAYEAYCAASRKYHGEFGRTA